MDYLVALAWGQMAAGAIILALLLFVSAPYGKHSRSGWGPMANSRLAWLLMELPACAVILVPTLVMAGIGWLSLKALVLLGLWEFHYVYRTFLYPALLRGPKKSFPLALVGGALLFNAVNGWINGSALAAMGEGSLLAPAFVAGLALFGAGFALHCWSDAIIRGLRRGGRAGYFVPEGFPFRLCGNPNYLGECLQWAGWALAAGTLAGWAFAWFSLCNLFPRAIANDRFYRARFPDYPAKRKVFLPFVF